MYLMYPSYIYYISDLFCNVFELIFNLSELHIMYPFYVIMYMRYYLMYLKGTYFKKLLKLEEKNRNKM